jgi:hypothetical protein
MKTVENFDAYVLQSPDGVKTESVGNKFVINADSVSLVQTQNVDLQAATAAIVAGVSAGS